MGCRKYASAPESRNTVEIQVLDSLPHRNGALLWCKQLDARALLVRGPLGAGTTRRATEPSRKIKGSLPGKAA